MKDPSSPIPSGVWPCLNCDYDLRGGVCGDDRQQIVCPECGRQWRVGHLRDTMLQRLRREVTGRWTAKALLPSLAGFAIPYLPSDPTYFKLCIVAWVWFSFISLAQRSAEVMPHYLPGHSGHMRQLHRIEKVMYIGPLTFFLTLMNLFGSFLLYLIFVTCLLGGL